MKKRKKVHLEKGSSVFLAGQKNENGVFLFSNVGTRGINLSLTLGTAKFKQLD